jgi:hypothetical protein
LGKLLWSRQLSKPDRSVLDRKARTIHVFEQGCVLGDEADGVGDGFRWGDVAHFTQRIVEHRANNRYQSTDYSFGFKLPDRAIQLTGRSDKRRTSVFEGFSQLVSPLVCAAQLPGMLTRLHDGETLEFAGLKVALAGLASPHWRKKNEHLAWRELKSAGVSNGELQLWSQRGFGPWYVARAGDVPNLDALLEILRITVASL